MLLNADQLMIRDMARNFAREHLLPFAAERDRHHEFPAVALGEMGALGLLGMLGMLVPMEWDGAESGGLCYM